MKSKIETIRAIQILSSSKLIIQKSRREENMFRVFRTLLFLIATISLLVTSLSCHRTPIEPEKIKANLIYEDALCTEAYLRLKLAYIDFPANVDLYVDKNKVNSFRTFSEDTVIMVENLLPKKSYTSYVKIYPAGGGEIVSNEVSFTTMDTTSHNFTWQVFEFGNFGPSALFDVAIINENDIWAVGEIYVADTNINGYTMYNAVHWDGNKWELKKVSININGIEDTPIIRAICAFNENDIWFGIASIIRWDGKKYNFINTSSFFPALINKMWGSSNKDIYIVGNNGNIAHWDGKRWTKIESGTKFNINDIWGYYNFKENKWEVLSVCGNILQGWQNDREIIEIQNKIAKKVNANNVQWPLSGIWFKSNKTYYVVGSGIYYNTLLGKNWVARPSDITRYFIRTIRANDINDVFAVGAFGEFLHFNGYNWKSFMDETFLSSGEFFSLSVKGNIVVAVGYNNRKGVIFIGKRK
jgi:hypothetical protein